MVFFRRPKKQFRGILKRLEGEGKLKKLEEKRKRLKAKRLVEVEKDKISEIKSRRRARKARQVKSLVKPFTQATFTQATASPNTRIERSERFADELFGDQDMPFGTKKKKRGFLE